ncbi:MAG: exodeoxyribonuclease VII small subunit [Spirochaetaceae bacterium]|nr:exodeoxyribonuclease VII small subunit [Spirochaetaceae bacterium]
MKNFEERLQRLEEISEKIRVPTLPLEEAFSLFEEGVKLSGSLEKEIGKLEGKVRILINGEELEKDSVTDKKEAKSPEFALFSQDDL